MIAGVSCCEQIRLRRQVRALVPDQRPLSNDIVRFELVAAITLIDRATLRYKIVSTTPAPPTPFYSFSATSECSF
jgi:hypothetical protein